MLRSNKIKSALYGGVGFRQPTVPEYAILDEDNTTSYSGLRFEDVSGFVNVQNIYDCQYDKDISASDFNALLKSMQEQAIDDTCRAVIRDKSIMLYNANLYPYKKLFSEVMEPSNGFVGFEITSRTCSNMAMKVEWVELSFNATGAFYLYLFNSNKRSYINRLEVSVLANESKIVNLSDWFISDGDDYKGGKFYLGYFESDLNGINPTSRNYELSSVRVSNHFFEIEPVRLECDGLILNAENEEYLSDTYGLNLGISIYEDYTSIVIDNKHLFYPAIQHCMAVKVLGLIKNSIRSNMTSRLNKENIAEIDFDIFGNPEIGIRGLEWKFNERVNDIRNMIFFDPMIQIGTLS